MSKLRTPPHNIDAEQALLACCIQEGGQESITFCIENKIISHSFYKPSHKIIFQSLIDLYQIGDPVDEVILCQYLISKNLYDSSGGSSYIHKIIDRIDTPTHLPYYLKIVKNLYIIRSLIKLSLKTIEECYSGQENIGIFLETIEQQIFKISEDRISDSAKNIFGPITHALSQINFIINNRGEAIGISSGFIDLDKLTSGFKPQEMIVVAARPSMGKTSLALNIAESILIPKNDNKKPVPTLIFSLEMSAEQLAMRLLCSYSNIDMQKLKDGFLDKESNYKLEKGANLLKNLPLWIDDSGNLSILEMRAKARRIQSQKSLGLVIIDYLQLISGPNFKSSREQQISEISRGIKSMAKELNVPVIVLSQLNRDSEKERRQPRLSDLRESGSIEQDADLVLILSKQKDSDENIEKDSFISPRDVIIAKQRNGPVGVITLGFNKRFTRFENYVN